MACAHTSRQIILLADDVVADAVDGPDVRAVARERRHVGHAGVHIPRAHGVTHGLVLFRHRLVALAVRVLAFGFAAHVEEESGLVEIALVAREHVHARQCHLGYLMARNHVGLPFARSHLAYHAVGVTLGYVEKLGAARGLIVCAGGVNHVSEVVELVAEVLHGLPAARACPRMRFLGVYGACGVEVAVFLLGGGHDVEHAVYVLLHPLVGISLEQVTRTLDGLVYVSIVEREAHEGLHVVVVARVCGLHEVGIAPLALAFAEGQRYGRFACSLDAVAPESVRGNLHRCKRYRSIRVTVALFLPHDARCR